MQVTVSRQALEAGRAWVAGAVPKRPVLPVLGGILLSVEDRTLTLGATDYEQGRRAWASDTWGDAEDGHALVDAAELGKIARALPKPVRGRPVDVRLRANNSRLTVTCQGAAWDVPLLAMEEYPAVPQIPRLAGTADATRFALAVNRTAAAAGTDDTLPVLTCVQFTPGPAALTLAATDRYRVAVDQIPWTALSQPAACPVLAPARAVTAFAAKAGRHGDVAVHIGVPPTGYPDERIGFRDSARELTVALFDGHTPPPLCEEHLREASPVNLTVDARALTGALRRMNPVTARGWSEATRAGIVDLRYEAGGLTVNALGPGLAGTVASETVPARADCAQFTVRFCAPYLWVALEGIDGEAVIGLDTGDKARLAAGDFRAEGVRQATVRGGHDEEFRAAVMPVRADQ